METHKNIENTVLRIPPLVPDHVGNLSFLKAHRDKIELSSRPHRKLTNATVIQISYLQYARSKNTRKIVLRISPFVPGDVKNLSFHKAHRKKTDISKESHEN